MMRTPVKVELFYDAVWNDITSDVYTRNPISITRGRQRENERVAPSQLTLSIKNTSHKYSPRNPESVLYGKIGRNTPIRVYTEYNTTADITEDFEDTNFLFTITSGVRNSFGGTAHSGSWVWRTVNTSENPTITIPTGATLFSFWFWRGVGTPYLNILIDGVKYGDTSDGAQSAWTEYGPFDVGGATTIVLQYVAGSGNSIIGIDDVTFSWRSYRFWGEVANWPMRWTVDANDDGTKGDVWAPVKAYGPMRRLGGVGSQAAAKSALGRWFQNVSPQPVSYWSFEDGSDAVEARSGLDGGPPLRFNGPVQPGNADAPHGASSGIRTASGFGSGSGQPPFAAWLDTGNVVYAAGSNELVWEVWMRVDPTASAPDGHTASQVTFALGDDRSPFTRPHVSLQFDSPSNLGTVDMADGTDTAFLFGSIPDVLDGNAHHIRVELVQSGASTAVEMFIDGTSAWSDTATSVAIPDLSLVYLPGQTVWFVSATPVLGLPVIFSHMAIYDDVSAPSSYEAGTGYSGETAADRITRVCGEEGISVTIIGDESALMGPQPVASVLDLLHDSGDADGGLLFESRDAFGLKYRTHTSFYNQDVDITLDYAAGGEVAPPLEPSEDTDFVQNDVTVTRVNGGSSRAVQLTGPLNVSEPVDDLEGVGKYPVDRQLTLETDDQTLQQAGWIKHLGTWDEPRYPSITMDPTAMDADGKSSLITDAVALDLGDRLVIENPPKWQGPDSVDQLVQGYTEVLASHHWALRENTTPAGPWNIGVLDTARLGGTTTISEDLTTTETDITVPTGIFSTTSEPYAVICNGEVMTVTTATSTVLTVTRSVNGVVRIHTTGDAISIYQPLRLARGA